MRLALAQLNPTVGDLEGNARKVLDAAAWARERGARLIVFPELFLTGYPPEDLLERSDFLAAVQERLTELSARLPGITAVLGAPLPNPRQGEKPLLNAAVVLEPDRPFRWVGKRLLPAYDVFDEPRHFAPAAPAAPLAWEGRRLGLTVCEDLLGEDLDPMPYAARPLAELVAQGAELIVNLSASPFSLGKIAKRDALLSRLARRYRVPIVLVNQVGAQGELIFDGSSRAYDPAGRCRAALAPFEEELALVDLEAPGPQVTPPAPAEEAQLHGALLLGLRDYVRKVGAFERVVLGLSGGIDSSLSAALAAEALGPERVLGLSLPSRYSSPGSRRDAARLAANLGITLETIEIERAHRAFEELLRPLFAGRAADVAEENLQARIRGTLVMALANKFAGLALACGNKSELATGYATLYGDLVGGLAPLGDVYKTQVYRLARWLNRRAGAPLVPAEVFGKAPSAELRPGQLDAESLPSYDVLDDILRRYLEEGLSAEAIVAAGHDPALVHSVLARVEANEHKRRQAPPVLRVSRKAFGRGRRFPLVQRWRVDVRVPQA